MKSKQKAAAFSLKEAAQYVGVCESVLLSLIKDNQISARKARRRWIVSKKVLDAWLEDIGENIYLI